ncbi:MAG: UDP-N-acetylmuramoyl-L-alanine--D-glutamate ligase [Candidatus Daviesbacteria bacterium]|nr:UDP-N-acetylmuramoyl-L-alanine--D-glutamate ligase [Candidatus Daviesbacteria bacterium]
MKNNYQHLKILILGLGINQGGVGAAKFFAKQGSQVIVTDLKTAQDLEVSLAELKEFSDIKYTLGEHKFEDIDWADLIIKNPAVKPGNKYIEYAKSEGKRVEMDMGIFLEYVSPKQIIGVTGTKGKSTTASLIYEILLASLNLSRSGRFAQDDIKKNIVFAGNIGKSVLDTITHITQDSLVILELSSFQLEAFAQHQISPHISIITNIFEDHLNYYSSMDDYIQAKRYITEFQTEADFLFIKKGDPITDNPIFLKNLKAKIVHFSKNNIPDSLGVKLIHLRGVHNLENAAAAFNVAKTLGIDESVTLEAIQIFKGIEFRMQLTREWKGVKIYNDTAATSPQAAIENIKTFPNCIWIGGGVNKNLPYEALAKTLDEYAKSIYFLEGDATDEIEKEFRIKNLESSKIKGKYDNLKTLLSDVKKEAKEGDVILFSPGAASFNLFKNEFDRGRKFNEAVEKIFN